MQHGQRRLTMSRCSQRFHGDQDLMLSWCWAIAMARPNQGGIVFSFGACFLRALLSILTLISMFAPMLIPDDRQEWDEA